MCFNMSCLCFRGKFESRDVAVKRILSEYVTIADKEVCHFSANFSYCHYNILRVFATESDTNEICQKTQMLVVFV